MERVRVGLVGVGYWGPNWVRTLLAQPDCELAAVCDRSPGRLQFMREQFPSAPLTESFADLLADPTLDAVVIATPVTTHRTLAERAFAAGKHVLVEKPLASSVEDASAMVSAADRAGRVLGTGHIFVYHPAVEYLRTSVQAGALGQLCYAESGRVNLGPPASEVDVIWDLAVHDVSILLSLLGHEPSEVLAEGRRYLHPSLTDMALLTLRFDNGFVAQHHVSWLSPVRVRRFFLAGKDGSATFDATSTDAALIMADRGEDSRIGVRDSDAKALFYQAGELKIPNLHSIQPLANECKQFLKSVRTGCPPVADGRAGLAVVRVLQAASKSVELGARPVSLTAV